MSFLFPYWQIEKGSRVALYGFGRVGQDFFMQMELFGYCHCVLVTDSAFRDYEDIRAPFARPEELAKTEFDYIVIAVLDQEKANEIKTEIKRVCMGNVAEQAIIWSRAYAADYPTWPANKGRYLSNPDFYQSITKKYFQVRGANWRFPRSQFYQSYSEIGIPGIRNTQERIAIYGCRDYLKSTDQVLDIGCNCGFFDLQISSYVGQITGMDPQDEFVQIANETKKILGIKNATFVCADYANARLPNSYDAIFSLAVHSNVILSGISIESYMEKIMGNLAKDGILFFESHDLRNDKDRYKYMVQEFSRRGMEICRKETYKSDFERTITVFRKMN